MDDRFRALFRRYREKLGDPDQARDQATALVGKSCGDETGMQAIGGDPSTKQPVGEFARKKNVAKLGAAIGFHGSKTIGQLQIVETRIHWMTH